MKFELITDRSIERESYEELLSSDGLVIDLGAQKKSNKPLLRTIGELESGQGEPDRLKAHYLCTDIQVGELDFVSDVQHIPLATDSIDAAICHSVIEHVEEPWTLAQEIHRVLRPGGKAFIYAPFLYPYHSENTSSDEHAGGKDCYRFTVEGLKYLFREFSVMKVSPVDYGLTTWWRFAVFFHFPRIVPWVKSLQRFLDRRAGGPIGLNQASGYEVWLEK